MMRWFATVLLMALIPACASAAKAEDKRTYPDAFNSTSLPKPVVDTLKRFDLLAFPDQRQHFYGPGLTVLGSKSPFIQYHAALSLRKTQILDRTQRAADMVLYPGINQNLEPGRSSLVFLRREPSSSELSEESQRILQEFFLDVPKEDLKYDPKLLEAVVSYNVEPLLKKPQFQSNFCIINRFADGYEIQKTVVQIVLPKKERYRDIEKQLAIACFFRGRAFHLGLSNVLDMSDDYLAPYDQELKRHSYNSTEPLSLLRDLYDSHEKYVGKTRDEVLLKLLKHMEQDFEKMKNRD